MDWTEEQQRAISERGKNILVAAAAGSGKTAVLVERIKSLVLREDVPVDRMLIVTFTNAAASEIKEKLRKSLTDGIWEDRGNGGRLRKQLELLPRASVSTFHAFALDVIRRFFFFTDLEPGFSVCDEAERVILKEDAMDELLKACFEEGSREFYDFLDCYSSDRNFNNIREIIDSSYTTLLSLPYPWKWLEGKVRLLSMDEGEMAGTDAFKYMWEYTGESLKRAEGCIRKAYDLLTEKGLSRLAEKLEKKDLTSCALFRSSFGKRDFEALRKGINGFRGAKLAAAQTEKANYREIKVRVTALRREAQEVLKELEAAFFTQPLKEQIRDINKTAPAGETLQRLLIKYDRIFREKKKEKKFIDFNDIEHYCLDVLQRDEAAEYYRRKYRYIFIDEYQDTSIIQEEIISKVKRENNLFMVGDVKQSIYRFRLAEPEIFRRKYQLFRDKGIPGSMKIDLNRNFRSKTGILDGVNRIFEGLMEGYDENARLYPGIKYRGPCDYKPEIRVIDMASAGEADEELETLKAAELEALKVCQIIKENIGRTIFDQKTNCERPISLADIVILMRAARNYAGIYYKTLKEQGIESFVDESESYFDTMEIDVWMKLLSIIDNKQQDIPLISVLRSEIFGFFPRELAAVRFGRKTGTYAKAFLSYAEDGEDPALRGRCKGALESIARWRRMSLAMPLGKFIWRLMMESGYYLAVGAMPGGAQRQMNLRTLVDKAEKYASERPGTLYNFIRYIEALKHRRVQVGQAKLVGEKDNLVRIMTVHKSKGLEFPMVILCGAGRRLNYTASKSGIALHRDIGFGMSLVNCSEHWKKQTLLQRLIKKQIHREEAEEEVRILYVALTRAKDLLYVTGTVKDGGKFEENIAIRGRSDSSFLKIIGDSYPVSVERADTLLWGSPVKDIAFHPDLGDNYKNVRDEAAKREIERKLDYRYPYEDARKLKSKYSVSELYRENNGEFPGRWILTATPAWSPPKALSAGMAAVTGQITADDALALATPKFRQAGRRITAAERGTLYHSLMERIDFEKAMERGLDYIKEAADNFVERGVFTSEEIGIINLSVFGKFFDSETGKRCGMAAKAGKLWKERSFNLRTDMNGEKIMIQGIIDCCFEEKDGFVLLDYKSGRFDLSRREEEEERLRSLYGRQLCIYKKALEASAGKTVKETYIYHLESGIVVKI